MWLRDENRRLFEVKPQDFVICVYTGDAEYYKVGEILQVRGSVQYLTHIGPNPRYINLSGCNGRWAPHYPFNDVSDLL